MLGKTPEDIEVTRPIRNGVISDYIMTERMLKIYVKSAIAKRKIWGKTKHLRLCAKWCHGRTAACSV